jgi:hypothetical protein
MRFNCRLGHHDSDSDIVTADSVSLCSVPINAPIFRACRFRVSAISESLAVTVLALKLKLVQPARTLVSLAVRGGGPSEASGLPRRDPPGRSPLGSRDGIARKRWLIVTARLAQYWPEVLS